jgi:translocation and assembly module TamB
VFGARLDGSVAGIGPPSDFRVAGTVSARALDVGGVRIDAVDGSLSGRLANLRLGGVNARGPWGDFSGSGAYDRGTLALAGRYRGSFTQLRSITGELGARGPIDGPVDLLLSPERTLVQARGATSRGATVDGVPVDDLAGTLAVAGKHVRIYAATASVAGGTFAAAGDALGARGVGVSVAGADARALHAIAPLGAGRIDAIGALHTRDRATGFDGGVALGGGTLDRLPIAGNGDLALSGNRLNVRRTDGRLGDALGTLDGSLAQLGSGAPVYDVNLHVPGAEIAPFARIAAPDRRDIAGTLSADVRLSGSAADLRVDGRVAVPEGTVNGLAFRDAAAGVQVTRTGLFVRSGAVTVGSTSATFGAEFDGANAAMRFDAARADLADFNDYFDAGDTLGGTGHVAVTFDKRGTSVRSNADIAIANLEYRRFDLGNATAVWSSHGRDVDGKLAFGGASGRLQVAGTYEVATHAPLEKFFERSRFDGTAHLRGLDLGVWLPAIGYQLPVGGRVDADATIAGPMRDPSVDTTLTLVGGSLGRFPVDRLEVSAVTTLRRTTITRAALNLPSVEMTGAGSFGFGERDPIAFSLHAKSPDIGTVALRVAGSSLALSGAAEADVKIDGTRAKPRVAGGFDLEHGSLHGVAIPQALGEFSIAGRDLVLSDAEIGLAKGTLYLAGSVPLVVAPFGFGPGNAPITLDFDARGVDLANFAPLLPAGSTLAGTLDGHVAVGGTAGDPRLDGKIAVASAAFRGPFETVPLENIGAQVTFSGSTARLDRLHAEAGGGSVDASGRMIFANLVRPGTDADYRFDARATHLGLALPAYGSGQLDGTLSVVHVPQQPPSIAGDIALSEATIPFAALLFADTGSGGFDASQAARTTPAPTVAEVALNLDLSAQRNVRVRSGNVDIGARGTLHVGGTSIAPSLSGGFVSTGGTLTYFNTVFRLLDGQVTFEPDLGVIPNLDAHAIAHVINPDPNTVRNVTGGADVTLALHGPVTSLSIALSSDPSYDREQILGLLLSAPALGATNLFATTGQPTLYGTTQTNVPPGTAVPRNTNGEFSVAQEAFGVANAQFTRVLLAPIESTVAEAVGLSNINVNVDYLGNVGVTARKILGKKVNAIYGASFGYPYRQTFGFEFKQNEVTAAQVTVFQTLGAYGLNSLTPYYLTPNNLKVQAAEPNLGPTGFSLSLQHLF